MEGEQVAQKEQPAHHCENRLREKGFILSGYNLLLHHFYKRLYVLAGTLNVAYFQEVVAILQAGERDGLLVVAGIKHLLRSIKDNTGKVIYLYDHLL